MSIQSLKGWFPVNNILNIKSEVLSMFVYRMEDSVAVFES